MRDQDLNWPTQGDFRRWLDLSKPGERFVYYCGDLARDRVLAPRDTQVIIFKLADLAWRAARMGLVSLVQHRRGPHDYEYIAEKRR